MTVATVTPVVSTKDEPKLIEVKVSIEESKEVAAILYTQTDKIIALAFTLQDSYENASQYRRDALHDASVMFLKAQCQRMIGQWDNLVSKMTKLQKYSAMPRPQIEAALKIHPKYKPFWEVCVKATGIKNTLK